MTLARVVVLGHAIRAYLFVYIPGWKIGLEPIIRILISIIVGQTVLLLDLIVFVIARINHYRWMVTQSLDLCYAFSLDRVSHIFVCWVIPATEHEVLPHEDTEFITGLIKDVLFPYTATPDSDTNR